MSDNKSLVLFLEHQQNPIASKVLHDAKRLELTYSELVNYYKVLSRRETNSRDVLFQLKYLENIKNLYGGSN